MSKVSAVEKTFTAAGLVLIAVGCLANLYGAYVNQRFIYDPFIDPLYYFRYVILLLGGFAAGYCLSKKSSSKHGGSFRLYNGIFYAVFAAVLFFAFDISRILIRNLFGDLGFPWEKIIFEGLSLFALLVTLVIAYFTQYRQKNPSLHNVSKKIFVVLFIAYELYTLATNVSSYASETSAVMVITSYLITPLVIAIISYLFLSNKKPFERLFYASFIGAIYSILIAVSWEFRVDASIDSTIIFSVIATCIALAVTGFLLWRVRRALSI